MSYLRQAERYHKSNYLDDLKALTIQGERGFWNRVDKVVHGNHKLGTTQKSCEERERKRERVGKKMKRGSSQEKSQDCPL